jgi:chitodextrinase
VSLSGLAASTRYYLRASAVDAAGNGPTTSALVDFTTLPLPDVRPPRILSGPLVLDITDSAATVVWQTDEPATSGLSYNDGTRYGVMSDERLVTEHSVRLTGLTPNSAYFYTVSSRDQAGNGPTLSETQSFVTTNTLDTEPPSFTHWPTVKNVTHQSAVIDWRTDEPADSRILFGLAADALTVIEARAALVPHHNLVLTGLQADTVYYLRVQSTDNAGNTGASPVSSFRTDRLPRNEAPVLVKPSQVKHKTDDSITLEWETDRPTDAAVECEGNENGVLVRHRGTDRGGKRDQKHQVTVTNLLPDVAYNCKAISTDEHGNKREDCSCVPSPTPRAKCSSPPSGH